MALIKNFTAGEEISTYLLIKSSEIKQTRGTPPKDYLDIILADQSGEISAKLWDASSVDKESFTALQVAHVKGIVQPYKEKLQFKIDHIRKVTKEEGVSIAQFIRSAPIPPEQLMQIIQHAASSIQEPMFHQIVKFCMDKTADKLSSHPAAKTIHHAFYGGLAYHIVRMLEVAEFLVKQRPFLHADLLIAGIILHDIAKTEELDASQGVVNDYSITGKLLGHISIASNWIVEAAVSFGFSFSDERIIALQHMILAHHNKGEYGSPVQPQLPEAVALHYIDLIDSRMQAVEDAMDSLSPQSNWTPQVRAAENMSMYKMKWT